jgi:hypothetical protein
MRQLQNNSIDLKNVWPIFPSPLAVNLSWERLELAILEASDQMISHAMLFEPFALYGNWYAHFLTLTHTQTQ